MKSRKIESLKTISMNIKMYIMLFIICSLFANSIYSQTLCYDNFEGKKSLFYKEKSGVLDTLVKNPSPNTVDSSKSCAMYVRNGSKLFDNIKMSLLGKLYNVDSYATYQGIPKQITMKIYTTAPVGTLIEILLGSKARNNEYPAGTNSQYQAYTTVSNAWEEVKFKFSQVPLGSETSFTEIDQVTLLFNPNTSTSDTYYFDDITGPPLHMNQLESKSPPKDLPKVPPMKSPK